MLSIKTSFVPLLTLLLLTLASVGCVTAPETTGDRAQLEREAWMALGEFKQLNPEMHNLYQREAIAVAVFPTVGKGGLIFGGAFGQGVLFENGELQGYSAIRVGSVGAQVGGQAYREIVFFRNESALQRFKLEKLELAAQATAVAITANASANAEWSDGVAVFTFGARGAMAEATIAGQKFDYIPKENFGE